MKKILTILTIVILALLMVSCKTTEELVQTDTEIRSDSSYHSNLTYIQDYMYVKDSMWWDTISQNKPVMYNLHLETKVLKEHSHDTVYKNHTDTVTKYITQTKYVTKESTKLKWYQTLFIWLGVVFLVVLGMFGLLRYINRSNNSLVLTVD